VDNGARKLNNQTIEISSGSIARNPDSMLFATVLKTKFLEHEILKNYKICGNFNFIHFKAVKSATITDERWKPFHIELPPSIRLDNENRLPSFINDFNNFLVETIREVCI